MEEYSLHQEYSVPVTELIWNRKVGTLSRTFPTFRHFFVGEESLLPIPIQLFFTISFDWFKINIS